MTVITILGAGGKMGNRVTQPLLDTKKYELRFVEKSEAGQARIREAGNTVMELDDALKGTDVVIFTTPSAPSSFLSWNRSGSAPGAAPSTSRTRVPLTWMVTWP